jgi:hypothetical protein
MKSASAMRPSMAARPPNRYGTGECHGEGTGGGAVHMGMDALGDGAGLMALDRNLCFWTGWHCLRWAWQFLSRERERERER